MRFNNRSIFITTLAAGVIAFYGVGSPAVAATAQSSTGETAIHHVNPEDRPSVDNGDSDYINGRSVAMQIHHVNPADMPSAHVAAAHRSGARHVADSVHHVNPEDVPSANADASHRFADRSLGAGNEDNSKDRS